MSTIKFTGREAELTALRDLFKEKTVSLVVIKGAKNFSLVYQQSKIFGF